MPLIRKPWNPHPGSRGWNGEDRIYPRHNVHFGAKKERGDTPSDRRALGELAYTRKGRRILRVIAFKARMARLAERRFLRRNRLPSP